MKNNNDNDCRNQPAIEIIIEEIIHPHKLAPVLVSTHIQVTFRIDAKETGKNCRNIKSFISENNNRLYNNY